MALDPNAEQDPFLSWYYGLGGDPSAAAAPTDPLALTEYGLPGGLAVPQLPPPPPPPPPPVQKFGGQPPIEETAAPVPAAADVVPSAPKVADLVDLTVEPGSTAPAPALPPAASSPAMLEGEADPWDLSFRAPGSPPPPDARAPEMPVEYATSEELGAGLAEIAARDPVAYAGYRAAKQAEHEAAAANARARAVRDDTVMLEANLKARAEAKAKADAMAAQVDQEAKQLSADGGFSDSTGRMVAAFAAIIAGGLGARATGGRNLGAEMVNQHVDRFIAAQRAKLADRRNSVTQMYARLGNDFATNEAIRAATWKQVEARLLTEQQNYDPRGTAAIRIADQINQARAQQRDALIRVQTAEEKRQMQLAEFELKKQAAKLDQERLAEQKRHAKAEEGIAWKNASTSEKRLALDEKQGMAKIELEAKKLEAEGKEKEAQVWRERGISGLEVPKLANGKPVLDKATGKFVTENKPLLNKDGTKWIPQGTPEAVNKLRNHKAAADKLVDIFDQVDALSPEYLTNTGNSAKLQKLKQLWADAKLTVKDAKELGVIAGPDLDLIEDFLGASDLTQFKSSSAGRASARARVIAGMQQEMKAAGYDGDPYNPPNVYERQAPEGEEYVKQKQQEDLDHAYDVNGNLTNPPGKRDPRTGMPLFE